MCVRTPVNDIFLETIAKYHKATKWFVTLFSKLQSITLTAITVI